LGAGLALILRDAKGSATSLKKMLANWNRESNAFLDVSGPSQLNDRPEISGS
jgi:hypothetical protein